MSHDRPVPAFGLVIVGDEILSGKRADKHMPKVIELLAERGLSLSWVRYVGDDRPRLQAALRDAFASGDIVFSCGGIGATPDDHTRQCAAAALGVELELHPEAKALIEERMRDVARNDERPGQGHARLYGQGGELPPDVVHGLGEVDAYDVAVVCVLDVGQVVRGIALELLVERHDQPNTIAAGWLAKVGSLVQRPFK